MKIFILMTLVVIICMAVIIGVLSLDNPLLSLMCVFVGIIFTPICIYRIIDLRVEQDIADNHISKALVEEIDKRTTSPSKQDIVDILIKAEKAELDLVDAIRMCDPSISEKMAEDILEQSRINESLK